MDMEMVASTQVSLLLDSYFQHWLAGRAKQGIPLGGELCASSSTWLQGTPQDGTRFILAH